MDPHHLLGLLLMVGELEVGCQGARCLIFLSQPLKMHWEAHGPQPLILEVLRRQSAQRLNYHMPLGGSHTQQPLGQSGSMVPIVVQGNLLPSIGGNPKLILPLVLSLTFVLAGRGEVTDRLLAFTGLYRGIWLARSQEGHQGMPWEHSHRSGFHVCPH